MARAIGRIGAPQLAQVEGLEAEDFVDDPPEVSALLRRGRDGPKGPVILGRGYRVKDDRYRGYHGDSPAYDELVWQPDGEIAHSRVEQSYITGHVERDYMVLSDDPASEREVWNVYLLGVSADAQFGPDHLLNGPAVEAFLAVGEHRTAENLLGFLAAHDALESIREELATALAAI